MTRMIRKDPTESPSRSRHRRWALLAGGLLVTGVVHPLILRWLAEAVIADDRPQAADHLLVVDGERCFDRAAELYHGQVAFHLHMIARPAKRLEQLGVVPSWENQCFEQLTRRGVPRRAISAIPGTADENNPWQAARCLRVWMEDHPGTRILLLCDRFEGGGLRFVISLVLEARELERVVFRGLPDERYDETNWWRSRMGWRAMASAVFDLTYFRLHGEDAERPYLSFDPDAYERSLQ
jgi:hypothetical protein